MSARRFVSAWLLLAVLLLAAAQPSAAQQVEPAQLTLEEIFASATFYDQPFQGGRWAEEGPVVTYIESGGQATHLMSYNLETDARTRLIDGGTLHADDVDRLIQIEDYQYSQDGQRVLLYTDSERVWRLNTKGYYYVYDLEEETLTPLGDREAGFQMFAKFSPDGTRAAFVRDRNLFVVDLATMEETQLTTNGTEGGIINGTSDWVYEEEFGLRDGWSWSPDGRYIAFLQLDESLTRSFEMADLLGQYPEGVSFRYPKAGEVNSEIHVGVIDMDSYEQHFFDTGTWKAGGDSLEYIPQMGWTPAIDGTYYVWMFRLDRDQNDLDLLYGDPSGSDVRVVLQEQEDTWIDVETGFSDLDVGNLTYLDDGEHFVWISERDGYRHLYLYRNDGTLVRQISQGPWDVTDFHGVEESSGIVYFTAALESPMERHLYRMLLAAGTNGAAAPTRITVQPGWHDVNLSRDFRYYIDTYSSVTTPPRVTLHEADGAQLKVLKDNDRLAATADAYELPVPAFMTVPGADGTPLNASLIRPRDFDENRQYPLLMYVYGGPGSQTVRNMWGAGQGMDRYLWHAYLADTQDVVVVSVDNRGTGARGKAFKSGTYAQLGLLEARDQIAAAQHLAELPYIDAERVGIWGWSYGGYLTLMSMLYEEGPQTFHTGIAVAPVTDWRLYDTIYTERFLSTPQKNPEGYTQGSPQAYADRLREEQELLMIHGDADDNVHFQNVIQMADALQAANKQFSLMVYPGRNHGIYGGLTRLHLFTLMTDFVEENL